METTIPTITIMPMKDSMLSVVLVRYSVHITPIMPIGTANMIITGSRNERNCATITRYSRTTAIPRPKPKLENDFCIEATEPRSS